MTDNNSDKLDEVTGRKKEKTLWQKSFQLCPEKITKSSTNIHLKNQFRSLVLKTQPTNWNLTASEMQVHLLAARKLLILNFSLLNTEKSIEYGNRDDGNFLKLIQLQHRKTQ